MVSKKKVTISWSGGKDSAFALFKILLSGEYDVVHLHTTIDLGSKRVGLHGVPEVLMEAQAAQLGLPLVKLYLEASDTHDNYTALVSAFYKRCATEGIQAVVFGDIFLNDLRAFREDLLHRAGLEAVFPIWGLQSEMLLNDFINSGFKTVICAADASVFSENQLGVTIGADYGVTLPSGIDVCGENGEYHTFVYDGPLFKNPVAFTLGEKVLKTYRYGKTGSDGVVQYSETSFWFQDLLPLMSV